MLSSAGQALLAVEDLSVSFNTERGRVQAVNDLDLEIARGETLALVGESGSGKSVTALSVLGLLGDNARIDSGRILFDGQNLLALSPAALRSFRGNRVSMIFQEPMSSLNPVLTIGRQIAEPVRLHRRVSWRQAYARAEELLNRVSIPDARERLEQYPHHFSGGMRQRVMIAIALACDPQLIIADEPTTALDVTVQAQILELLKNLTRESGVALLLITHDLGVVARYAERVAVMYAGRVVETATARSLYREPRHPYTQGLIASLPSMTGTPGSRLTAIPGQPPDLARPPPGCGFAPRCPHARDRCRASVPPLEPVGPGHFRACVGYE